MKMSVIVCASILALLLAAPVNADNVSTTVDSPSALSFFDMGVMGSSTITITNHSAWTIHYLYISPVSSSEWGEDQLGDEVIGANGGTFQLSGVPCSSYDVKIVDEDGDVCIISDTDICGGSSAWTITSENLLACQNQ